MSSEPLYEQTKRTLGVDPDQIAFDGIVRNDYTNHLPEPVSEAYGLDMELTKTPIPAESSVSTLTAQDRCDRCAAAARFRAILEGTDFELLFCNHHKVEQAESLVSKGWKITE